ncbi:MAG TPA: RNA methyltransferase [Salinimicrobium sp.]|nr:RNA methyltransferase [Salinimicrobium sp.]
MHRKINSLQNPSIKKLLQLQEKSRLRKKEGLFVVEGLREIILAKNALFGFAEIFFCPELLNYQELSAAVGTTSAKIVEISEEVYRKIAYRESTEGVIAIAIPKTTELSDLKFTNPNPLILVAEAPEKPGNIGALLRTADAANLDAVLIANPKTDLFNPNIIRSSVGCVFTNKIATGKTSEIISFLKQNNICIYAAALQASAPYFEMDYSGASAIVVGTEDAGLSEEWLENSEKNIIIPMQGKIDSMNVSVAAGILIFEAKRQRNFQ